MFPIHAIGESFEGSIELVQNSCYNTSYFTYFVKDKNVRIDKFDSDHKLLQSLLIDIEEEKVFILSPTKKLYTQLNTSDKKNISDENFIILKTENSRMVNGFKCYQWRVKNIERNTEVAYWVSQNDFYFFQDLIKLLNRTDKTYEFFDKIPETSGFFPILSVERTLLRKEKSRISVLTITSKKINESTFKIPLNYKVVSQ